MGLADFLFKEKEENKDLLLQRKDDISSSKIKIDELRVQVAALKEEELKYSDLKSEQLKKPLFPKRMN